MADSISELASKSGVSPDLAKKGMGAVLLFFKEHIPADKFQNVARAVPGADDLMANAAEPRKEASGGILGAVSGVAGKFFGGAGGASALIAKLTQLGFSADQLQKFIPTVLDFLKSKLPDDVMNQITALIPSDAKAAH